MESTYPTPADRDPFLWKQAKARVSFRLHLRSYLIVNAGLWLIWAISSFTSHTHYGGFRFPWPFFAMIGWGIGLASHYFSVYHRGSEQQMVEDEYRKLKNNEGGTFL